MGSNPAHHQLRASSSEALRLHVLICKWGPHADPRHRSAVRTGALTQGVLRRGPRAKGPESPCSRPSTSSSALTDPLALRPGEAAPRTRTQSLYADGLGARFCTSSLAPCDGAKPVAFSMPRLPHGSHPSSSHQGGGTKRHERAVGCALLSPVVSQDGGYVC